MDRVRVASRVSFKNIAYILYRLAEFREPLSFLDSRAQRARDYGCTTAAVVSIGVKLKIFLVETTLEILKLHFIVVPNIVLR